jgi:hypothetical protein
LVDQITPATGPAVLDGQCQIAHVGDRAVDAELDDIRPGVVGDREKGAWPPEGAAAEDAARKPNRRQVTF